MSKFQGDYLGFTLGGIHSSQLNIIRVSNNDRYIERLSPEFEDATAAIPGGTGTYYWKTSFTRTPITIDIAFDDLRDEDIWRLKQIFNFNGVKELVFDEAPYKKYMVKTSSPPELQFIPFDEVAGIRVYKGEGIINLIAFYPYAIGVDKQNLIIYEDSYGTNVGTYGTNNKYLKTYNKGDFSCPFKIYYERPVGQSTDNPIDNILYCALIKKTDEDLYEQNFDQIEIIKYITIKIIPTDWQEDDDWICIDMKTHLIEGINSSGEKTGNLYNYGVIQGDFFELSQGLNVMIWTNSDLDLTGNFIIPHRIEYNELYY